ncbi:MAG: hypothetical protein IBJ13_07975 [Sphingopyxis sp.]|nr:hypothetical protein [Sphingopyxis sp.]
MLAILLPLSACTADADPVSATQARSDQSPEILYAFEGADDFWAMTFDKSGANLPSQHGPWKLATSVMSDDPRLTTGIDKGTVEEVRKRGFSLRQIKVTFEPSVTVPERQ